VLLAGRSWHITSIDWKRRTAWVEPAKSKGRSRWVGAGQPWSAELSESVRAVVCGADPDGVTRTQRAKDQLAFTRAEFTWARVAVTSVVESDGSARWWTWAGQRANAALSDALGDLRDDSRGDNLMVGIDPYRGTLANIREQLRDLDPSELPVPSAAAEFADGMKFSDCLPTDIALRVAAARLLDAGGVARVLKELRGSGEYVVAGRPSNRCMKLDISGQGPSQDGPTAAFRTPRLWEMNAEWVAMIAATKEQRP
jgi:ATP-dependent Lhr-like helicase